jgi:hypothetical protein
MSKGGSAEERARDIIASLRRPGINERIDEKRLASELRAFAAAALLRGAERCRGEKIDDGYALKSKFEKGHNDGCNNCAAALEAMAEEVKHG